MADAPLRAMFRVKGVSWWPEELPSAEEYSEALANLERAGWAVDCILTHCAPAASSKSSIRLWDRPADGLSGNGQAAVPVRLVVLRDTTTGTRS